jgi:hypothetical protein
MTHTLARVMWQQAEFWHRQNRFEEAKSEALRALDAFEMLGAAKDVERVRELLRQIDRDAYESDDDGELLTTGRSAVFVDSFVLRQGHQIRMTALTLGSSSSDASLHPIYC